MKGKILKDMLDDREALFNAIKNDSNINDNLLVIDITITYNELKTNNFDFDSIVNASKYFFELGRLCK